MVPGPSFYIYGGGRWREVDVSSGRIDGWGSARFAYTKRGKVHLAKSKHVLSALRNLKIGRKGAVSDGCRLPFKKLDASNNHRDNQTDTRTCECNYSHCCQRFSHRCPAKNTINHQSVAQNSLIKVSEIKVLTKSDAAIQASPPDSNKKSDKIVNKNTSSDDDVPSKITTTALNSSPNKLAKLKLKKQWSIAGSDKPQSENTPSLKLNKTDASKYIFYKRKRTDSESSAWVVMPKTDTKLINNAKDHANKSKHLGMRSQSTSSQTSQDSRSQKVVRTKSIVDMKPKPQDMKTDDSYAEAKSKLKRRRHSTTSQSSIESQPQKIVRRTKSIDVKSKSQNVKNNIDHADAKSKQLKMRRQSISSKSSQDSVPQKIVRRTKSVADTHPHNHAKKMKYTPKPIKDQDKVTEKYVTISGDDDIDHADAKSKQLKKRRQSISSKSSQESVPQKIVRRTKSVADTDAQNRAKKIKYAPKPIKDQDKVTEKHFTISDDDVVSDIDHADDKSKQLKKRRQSISSKSSQESVPQKIVRRTKSVAETHPYHHVKKMKYAPKPIKDQDKVTEKHVTSSEEDLVSEETEAGKIKFLELNIEPEDVEVLRNYLLHNASDFDLLKFDSSNGYKKKLFYSINPVVNLERCSMIARMLQNDRRDSQSEISLKDFASQLGLTSITEKKVPQRYKLRKRNSDKDTDRSESESEIENKVNKDAVKHSTRKRQTISTDLETDIDSEEDITTNTRSKVAQALPRRYTRSQSTGDSKDNNRKRDPTGKFSSKRKSSKSDGDYTDEDTSIEEAKTRTKPKRNTRNHLINQAENKKDNNRKSDAKETSAKRKTSKSDGDFTDDDYSVKEVKTKTKPKRNTRNQSAGDRKDNDPKGVTKSTSSKQKTSKSDGDYTDEDSSVEEDKTRVLRKRRGISNVDLTNISDSKDFQKSSNRSQNSKINNSIKKSKVNTMDLTKSSIDDSDCTTDTEEMTKNQKAKLDKRNNIDTDTNNEEKKMRSPKPSIKERRKSFNKRDTRQSDKQNEEDFNKQNTKLSRERNSRGQFKSLKKITTNDTNDSVDDNSKTIDKTTRKSDKNVTKTTNKSQTAENSEDAFKSKVKDKTQNKLNKTKEETNKDNSNKINMLHSEGDSADEFETYQKEKSKKRNKNISTENDRNNNMTDNDELSETELTKQTKTRSNKPKTNKVDNINDNSNESESSKKKASKSVSGNKKDNSDQVFFAPRIDEVKSLAGKTKVSRPPSSASSLQRVEYSNLEDHAIVSWISLGGRARCVNGNRIWRELQDQYQNLTGQPRTWHSLRNRYLRSILPRLGSMALNPSLVTRLRAAAATGEIKPQKGAPRRNSIFGAPVVGALSRKVRARSSSTEEELPAKRHKHDHTRKQPLPSTRELRSTQEFSPVKSLSSPRYSEITRNFAQKHRKSTPNSSEIENTEETSIDTKKPNKTSLETRKSVKNSLDAKNVSKTLTESESPAKKTLVLRSKRQISNDSSSSKSERISSTNRSPEKKMSETEIRRSVRNLSSVQATAKEQTRTRKLFNPNSMI